MNPADMTHGQRLTYNRGCRCQECRDAAARYERGRQWDIVRGQSRSVPIVGPRRRMQALVALGYDYTDMGRYLGVSNELVRSWATSRTFMYRRTAERIEAMYDALCMTLPAETNRSERNKAARARGLAKRKGWAPPLAWDDDIDDPNATPQGLGPCRTTATRADELLHLAHMGETLETACTVLKISADTLWKWCDRNGHSDLYERLAERSRRQDNQYTSKGAAA